MNTESADWTFNTYYWNDSGTRMAEFCLSLNTTVENSSCIPQTVTVEHTRLITIQHTQTVYNPTTVEICPTPSPLLTSKSSHFVAPNTVFIPACTPSTVIATIYQQPPIILSNITQISILTTCGLLICLPVSALVIVTSCWIRTHWTLKKKRNGMNIDHSVQGR